MSRKRHTPADEPHFLVRTLAAEFPDNHAIARHAHPWGQLIYSISGVMSVWTEHGSWVAPPHWSVWVPATVAHSIRFSGAASLRTLYLRPSLEGVRSNSSVITVSPLLRELILRAVETGFLDDREPTHVAITSLIVHEMHTHPARSLDLPMPRTPLLRRVAEHMAQTPGDRTGHTALAKRFGLGARTLERGFIGETGLSLGEWRRQARLLSGLRHLGTGAPVKQAASDAGFRSSSAFIAAFRTAFETTPGSYFQSGRP
jgi:AraC-like DNA-binding protein/quercetin dioxygenase-like cupin family protein